MREFGLKRMFLHATAVTFRWPDSRERYISVELPADSRRCCSARHAARRARAETQPADRLGLA
jgi:hypothetical protein